MVPKSFGDNVTTRVAWEENARKAARAVQVANFLGFLKEVILKIN